MHTGRTKMNFLLEKLMSNSQLAEVYCGSDFDTFSAGTVLAYDEKWILLSSVAPSGEPDGYICRMTGSISKISVDTIYLNQLKKMIDQTPDPDFVIPTGSDIFLSILDDLISQKKICTIELFEDPQCTLSGMIREIRDNFLVICAIDQSGAQDGLSVIKIEDISCLIFDSEDERRLRRLMDQI